MWHWDWTLSKCIPGAIRCRDGCCQQELVSPWLSSLGCHPGRFVHCLPFYILIQCNDCVPKCCSSQVPCQLSQGCSALAHLKCHWCCGRQRNSAFPCPSSTCHPRTLIQKSAALPTVPKKAPGASKFQSNGSDLRNAGDGCCREGEAGLQIQLLCWRQGWAGMAGICCWLSLLE